MGTVKVQICDIKWEGLSLANEPEDFPHEDVLRSTTSIDPDLISLALLEQHLTVRDGFINLGPYHFPIYDMIDAKASELKRIKKDAPDHFIPARDYITTEPRYTKLVSKAEILLAYKKLGPRRERACEDHIVMKGTLISVARSLNTILTPGERDMASDFDKSERRYAVIADWINWTFKRRYKIESSYDMEQVRKMITSKSPVLGDFVTLPFRQHFPEFCL